MQKQIELSGNLNNVTSQLNSHRTEGANGSEKLIQCQNTSLAQSNQFIHNSHLNKSLQKQLSEPKEALFSPIAHEAGQYDNFSGAPAQIFNQLYAFHTGAMNYHLQKAKWRPPLVRSHFPLSSKHYGQCHSSSNPYFYDLIFSHGNPPTLMGIPPIYPEANRT